MTLGLITEGITDQLVIDTIINTVINHETEKVLTTPLCPMDDEPSGYTKVFTYIQSEIFREALRTMISTPLFNLIRIQKAGGLKCLRIGPIYLMFLMPYRL